ncbi:MAG: hypothetical protein ACC707_21010 [Thiohalomonadales bacterium]
MKKPIKKISIYFGIALLLGYYVQAAEYRYERSTKLSYLLIDKEISKSEHSRLKNQNTLINSLLDPLAVFGYKK